MGMMVQSLLEQVLHCAENIQCCNDALARGSKNPLYTLLGVMDWAAELQRLVKEEMHFGEIMAARTVYDCDKCGKKGVECRSIRVEIDRSYDGAGYSTDTKAPDLCIDCLAIELVRFTKKLSYDDGKKWVNEVARK
jgi:hypothetical protein